MPSSGSPNQQDLSAQAEVLDIQRLMVSERLSIDEVQSGRTAFLSHIGAQPKLAPGPWIAHRELLYGLALTNLNPAQRNSLATAVLAEHDREFGVGRLKLIAVSSGLPLGGSSLLFSARTGGPRCLYTWALGTDPTPVECDWLLLRAQPEWALDRPAPTLSPVGLETLVALGGEVLVLVPSAVAAIQIATLCRTRMSVAAHPRFAPLLDEGADGAHDVTLWPYDGLEQASLRPERFVAIALGGASESMRQAVHLWASQHYDHDKVELTQVAIPGRIDREGLRRFWEACHRPKVLLSGDPRWASEGAAWLRTMGAKVCVQGHATQLSLL